MATDVNLLEGAVAVSRHTPAGEVRCRSHCTSECDLSGHTGDTNFCELSPWQLQRNTALAVASNPLQNDLDFDACEPAGQNSVERSDIQQDLPALDSCEAPATV